MHPDSPITRWRIGRRELLRWLVALAAWVPAPLLLAAAGKADPAHPPALGPFLDTLLPEDESPCATALGVDDALLDYAARDPNIARMIELGCAWLDREAGPPGFAGTREARRVTIVRAAEESMTGTLPWGFFNTVRQLAYRYYYSDPRSWRGLGFSGPPQPRGFAGHDQPPGEASP